MDQNESEKIGQLLRKGLENEDSLSDADRLHLRARTSFIKEKHQNKLPSVFGPDVEKDIAKRAKDAQKTAKAQAKADQKEAERLGSPLA